MVSMHGQLADQVLSWGAACDIHWAITFAPDLRAKSTLTFRGGELRLQRVCDGMNNFGHDRLSKSRR